MYFDFIVDTVIQQYEFYFIMIIAKKNEIKINKKIKNKHQMKFKITFSF